MSRMHCGHWPSDHGLVAQHKPVNRNKLGNPSGWRVCPGQWPETRPRWGARNRPAWTGSYQAFTAPQERKQTVSCMQPTSSRPPGWPRPPARHGSCARQLALTRQPRPPTRGYPSAAQCLMVPEAPEPVEELVDESSRRYLWAPAEPRGGGRRRREGKGVKPQPLCTSRSRHCWGLGPALKK